MIRRCSACKRIAIILPEDRWPLLMQDGDRDDPAWLAPAEAEGSPDMITDTLCPECVRRLYPDMADAVLGEEAGS